MTNLAADRRPKYRDKPHVTLRDEEEREIAQNMGL